ncbi:hypothetical protein B5181_38740, partial [Streptomyces sp. 4F]
GREEMARQYPRPALVLPYDFALGAAPVVSDGTVRGGLVLLWSGTHSPRLSREEREVVETGCRRLGEVLRQAADGGAPLMPGDRPRSLRAPAGRAPSPAEATALSAFVD